MNLGKFSLSLVVKDMAKSLSFYQTLGFRVIDGGHINKGFADTDTVKWRILEHESVKIGLFQGMFEKNTLSFNPKDVLGLQSTLKKSGVLFTKEAVADSPDGFISAMLEDPDGNLIMFDQM
jgi:catechol 2,3-dioxygenase-like lactoylglutathione lyase family enzyme